MTRCSGFLPIYGWVCFFPVYISDRLLFVNMTDLFGNANCTFQVTSSRKNIKRKGSMLKELLFTLFLAQVGTVAAITVCIVGIMALSYADIIFLNKSDPGKPLEAPPKLLNECA